MKAMLYGSGDVKLYAFIGVTYPEGSTCTCTNGVVTLKAKDTGGMWAFRIPKAGEWTVTATNGTRTKSETVSITAEGQFETVKLVYELMLYDAGNEYTSVTGGWSGYTSKTKTTMTAACNESIDTIKTANLIEYGDYKTLTCHVVSFTSYAGYGYPSQVEIQDETGKIIASRKVSEASGNSGKDQTLTIDVSDLATTSGIIAVTARGGGSGWGDYLYGNITVDKIWFSP